MNSEIAIASNCAMLDESANELRQFDRLARMNQIGLAQTSANDNVRSLADTLSQTSFQTGLLRSVNGITRNVDDALDAIGNATVEALRQESKGLAVRNWEAWLTTASRNAALLIIGKRKGLIPLDAIATLATERHEVEDSANVLLVAQLKRACNTKVEAQIFSLIEKHGNVSDAAYAFKGSERSFYTLLATLRHKLGASASKRLRREKQFAVVKAATGLAPRVNRYRQDESLAFSDAIFIVDLQACALEALLELQCEWTGANAGRLWDELAMEHTG